ncbi:expressed unknown protein [Seminavis robusta]|uniref:Uncharacterized protein n=1 Tax=Seminavis robusta TaxID=568900 RepID=A0A9N8EVT5_9STRA|nr:expressed unknown protein [Seminavis robusta]|eukprot:Sro1910_g304880.1 n/a (645) ;mRNA; f:9073-11007
MASVIDLDRVRRNDDRLSTLQLILSGAVDLAALKEVLRVNTKVSEVIIYVDESFLVELPVEETHDLFRTIGGMPNLQKLGFHSQSGSSGVLSIQALIAITSHATRMVHFGISDVALWGSQADFQLWATQLQTQLFLQSFCVCECELLEPSKECPLDPLLTVLSILPSLEALFLQAATPNALGQVSPEAVGAIGMAPQLQDLRLGNFELKHGHVVQMAKVLPSNAVLTELKLDASVEFHRETAVAMAKILRYNRRLKSLELGLTSMMPDDCSVVLAESLKYNTTLESFTLSRGANARFRPTISKACQAAFVEMLHQNYVLETLVLFQRFPVKKEFKLYLTLNKYGRGKLLMSHASEREDWIQAIHKVNDDLDSIFYYLSINPSLCNNCFDEEEEEEEEEPEEEEEEAVEEFQDAEAAMLGANQGPMLNMLYGSMAAAAGHKRQRPIPLAGSAFLQESAERSKRMRNVWDQQSHLPTAAHVVVEDTQALMPPQYHHHHQAAAAALHQSLQPHHPQLAAALAASTLPQQALQQQSYAAAIYDPRQHQQALSHHHQLQQRHHHHHSQQQPPQQPLLVTAAMDPRFQQQLSGFSQEQLACLQHQLALQQQQAQQQRADPPGALFAAAVAAAARMPRHPHHPHHNHHLHF